MMHHRHYYRNRYGRGARGVGGVIWLIPFFFFTFNHWWPMILIGVVCIIAVIMLFRATAMPSNGATWQAPTWQQPPQPQQPVENFYEYQPPEEPYQTGYRPQAPQQSAQPSQPRPQYEEPQVEYPQELPPMEQ